MVTDSPIRRSWKKFKSNRLALAGLFFITFILFTGIAGYLVMPDQTPLANDMHLQLGTKKPGRRFMLLNIRKIEKIPRQGIFRKLLFGQQDSFTSIPIISFGVKGDSVLYREYIGDDETAGITAIPLEKLTGRTLHVPAEITGDELVNAGIVSTRTFLLGTDLYGRDLLSRLILGIRVSLSVGILSVAISLIIGTSLGAAAGYFGGMTDAVISWLMNILWALPALLLVIALSFALGKGFWQVFIAVGLSMWVDVARLVRGQVIALKTSGYAEAARAMGFNDAKIITKHLLPNARGPILVMASANFASAILLEAGLSFLGFGVQPPMPSWGGMIKEHYGYIIMDAAYLAILPGLAIMLLVYAFNLVAGGLRDAFDVRSENKSLLT